MGKSPLPAVCASLAALWLLGSRPAPAGRQEEIVREKVAVVNVEVPVRVFLDGQPMAGLRKEDFRLFEDGEPQAINGFYQRRKKMKVQQVGILAEPQRPAPPRYFVLCFRILDFNDALRDGLDYFFGHILREQDQLLVLVNERTLLLNKDIWQLGRQEILEQVLREEALKARRELDAYFLRVRQDIDQTRLRLLVEGSRQRFTIPQIINFLQRYLNIWLEFKQKYLVPDLDKFYNFARHMQGIRAEKWVLNFCQIEMFPQMRISGPIRQQIDGLVDDMTGSGGSAEQFAKVIGRSLEAIDRAMNAADEFPADQIAKMLIRVDTTYHCFISSVAREGLSEDLQYKKVASDLENTLRAITARSGGEAVFSGDIGSALHRIVEKEDVYYVLTYEPKDCRRPGKVRIELKDPRCRLLYDDQVRSDYIAAYLDKRNAEDPVVKLDRVSLDGRRLHLEIFSFKMLGRKAGKGGHLRVSILILDAGNRRLYEKSRLLAAKESRVSLTVDFAFLKPGKHYFLVEASDLLTGRTVADMLPAEVTAEAP